MVYDEIMFGGCLVLLLAAQAALASCRRQGDARQARVLHFIRIGLSLSALSYFLRLADRPHAGHPSALAFLLGFSGTTFLWLGWVEHWRLRGARPAGPEGDEFLPPGGPAVPPDADGLPLTARARQALHHAQAEAQRRHEACVDTDHLLLGLLHDPGSAGVYLLGLSGAAPEKVHLELLGRMAPRRRLLKPQRRPPGGDRPERVGPLALTDRAGSVLALAAQEAHRFDEAAAGTEHLLLGLVLVGKGEAAAVLFGEGVTVDGIRAEIIKAKRAAR